MPAWRILMAALRLNCLTMEELPLPMTNGILKVFRREAFSDTAELLLATNAKYTSKAALTAPLPVAILWDATKNLTYPKDTNGCRKCFRILLLPRALVPKIAFAGFSPSPAPEVY